MKPALSEVLRACTDALHAAPCEFGYSRGCTEHADYVCDRCKAQHLVRRYLNG